MKSLTIFFFLSIQWVSISYAQNRVGNGGDGILCVKDNAVISAEILDFYESSSQKIELAGDYKTIVEERIASLKTVNPALGEIFSKRWKTMGSEIEWKKEIDLTDVQDSKHLFVPSDKNCQLKQIALRRNEVAANQLRFIIDESFWQKLSPISQAGLIMHEIIYEHFYKLGEKDSVKARTFNAYLFSPDFKQAGSAGFWKMIGSLKVPIYRK